MFKKLFLRSRSDEYDEDDTFSVPVEDHEHYVSPFAMASQHHTPSRNRRNSLGGIPRGGVDMTTPNEKTLDMLDRMLKDEPIEKSEILRLRVLLKQTRNVHRPTNLRQQLVHKYSGGREDVGSALTELIEGKPVPTLPINRTQSTDSDGPAIRYSRDAPRNLVKAETLWDFDAFALDHSTYNKPVQTLTMHLIKMIPDIESLSIDFSKLQDYLRIVEEGHKRHPYHGPHHVASVVQRFHLLLRNGLMQTGILDPLSTMACYIAAAVHDYGHTGFTNDYLVRTQHPFALTYNDIACHENYHCYAAMKLLLKKEFAFLERKEDYMNLRKLVIAMVLETDMARHFEAIERFKSLPFEIKENRDRDTILKLTLKCADLSHCGIDFATHRRWVDLLNEEFWAQGDLQKGRGMEVSPLMSRDGPGLSSTQAGFIEVIVMPMFQAFVDRYPDARPMLSYAQRNLDSWRELFPC